MTNIDIFLSILKFISIGLTGFFGILALAKPYRDKEGNLTRSGKIALRGAMVSFIVAALAQSLELQRSHNQSLSSQKKTQSELERFQRLLHEVQRTAPLTSLQFRLIVDNVPKEIRDSIVAGLKEAEESIDDSAFMDMSEHHEVDDNDQLALIQSVIDKKAILPFINWLATGRFKQEQSFLALGLDNNLSSLICIGWVQSASIGLNRKDSFSLLPSGILVGDEIEWGPSAYKSSPSLRRSRFIRPAVNIDTAGNSIILSVGLDPLSLEDALLRFAKRGNTTAFLPDDLLIFTWAAQENEDEYYIRLPIDTISVHQSLLSFNFVMDTTFVKKALQSQIKMRLELIPNDVEQILRAYDINPWSDGEVYEGSIGDQPRGYVRFWHGHSH